MRDFAARAWHEVAGSKSAYWAARVAQDRRSTWHAAQALLEHVRRVQPAFPTTRDRAADFEGHVKLCSAIDRAAQAFPRC
jgi:hypothetical protein